MSYISQSSLSGRGEKPDMFWTKEFWKKKNQNKNNPKVTYFERRDPHGAIKGAVAP